MIISTSIIARALIKYGYSNFQLDILEYCEPTNCIEREQYYIDLLKPEYNILTKRVLH
jgi:group I intron endonuclease